MSPRCSCIRERRRPDGWSTARPGSRRSRRRPLGSVGGPAQRRSSRGPHSRRGAVGRAVKPSPATSASTRSGKGRSDSSRSRATSARRPPGTRLRIDATRRAATSAPSSTSRTSRPRPDRLRGAAADQDRQRRRRDVRAAPRCAPEMRAARGSGATATSWSSGRPRRSAVLARRSRTSRCLSSRLSF